MALNLLERPPALKVPQHMPPIACEDDEVVRSGCGNLSVAANVEREMVSVQYTRVYPLCCMCTRYRGGILSLPEQTLRDDDQRGS